MTREWTAYLAATRQCMEQCGAMLELEQGKRQALLGQDGEKLAAMLQNQQAAVMQLESLEKKRLAAQEALGYPAELPAAQLLERLEDSSEKQELAHLCTAWRRQVEELRELNKTALDIAKGNLRLLEQLTGAGAPAAKPTYQKTGSKQNEWAGGSRFEEKI